ncbi:7TM GPCR serpentine receptor class x (Srx) domain-containing protein [Caenorhabditis elegans]|uniref:7TM GPCR serpentine receptor class x (Srx) domain-containing protein n=1 Tax=Caenorhabditis elegans TaxID=6239 RepID=Q20285_CAEEL|nr:7TM GPCR serpentine receptor class x (Srx) domain-containing protein [Caenorhabditis elegans]CCD71020.1 7TM GPCR serpentine receptor class x (Srx) domain-containing protein [Caenorhabditis elegans]|eukprot:NP_504255.3 Serpentine Receptor, class X [Caenorhabditis elegans]
MSSTLDQTLTITTIDIYVYNEFQSLLIAINRFIAMYAPLHYNKLCSVKVSVVIMALYYVKKIYGSLKSSYSVYEAGCQQYLDLATFKRQYENASCESTSTNNNNQRSNEDSASIRKNIRLFFQTVLQDSVFAIDQLFTFGLNSLSDHRIWLFVSTMLVWEMVHLLDGLIMLLFSNRLSTLKAIMVSKKLISIGGGKPSEARSGNQVHSLGEVG